LRAPMTLVGATTEPPNPFRRMPDVITRLLYRLRRNPLKHTREQMTVRIAVRSAAQRIAGREPLIQRQRHRIKKELADHRERKIPARQLDHRHVAEVHRVAPKSEVIG